ncbi:pilus assembly protein PilM [Candidatus Babeliales bacterium]|nr:pilus assembly protein PilM [Candidatus Babeliales bacterium]MCF7899267.1 pilus assembly protein PilM [Candidatus Babeliales bacterium]
MIKEIFLPEKLGSKRFYSQRILGFAIQENILTCAKVFAQSSTSTLENLILKEIDTTQPDNITHLTMESLKEIIGQIKKYDQIRVSIPSSLVIFKELEVPFKDPEKIQLILDYEIESMLPFSIDQAITDFIITKQDVKENKSQILVAAVRKDDLKVTLDIYESAGINPNAITIDLFAIYSLYQQIPEYKEIKDTCALIDLASYSTRVSILLDGQLKLTRIIPRGILSIVNLVSEELTVFPEEVKSRILSSGFQEFPEEKIDKSLKNHFMNLLNDVQFTLNSFSLKLSFYQGISKILLTGEYSKIKNISKICNSILQISCEIFDFEKLFSIKIFENKLKKIPNDKNMYLVALGTALPSIEQDQFNLRKKEFKIDEYPLIKKQLIAVIIMIVFLFATIFFLGYSQINKLSENYKKIEKEQIDKLKLIFTPGQLPKNINLKNLMTKANDLVKEKELTWAPFKEEKLLVLEILQELTNITDKRRFDVTVEYVDIHKENNIPKITVGGLFRSKTGEDHITFFGELAKKFKESKYLDIWNEKDWVDERYTEDGKAVKFRVALKEKEI